MQRFFNREQVGFWVMALLYLALELGYAAAHAALWDDDCATRFFNTQAAFSDPAQFVSPWNRPLFVLLFSLPAQGGYTLLSVCMSLITLSGAWALWRGLRAQGAAQAWLIVPLYLLQSYVFGISRHALTEPLAAALLCWAFLFRQQGRWLPFVLMGALIPLARLELTPLLLFWVWELWPQRRSFIPVLGAGLLVWALAAGLLSGSGGDFWVQLVEQQGQETRYGHLPLWHYAERLIHITGPVVFVWLLVGLGERIAARRWDAFVMGQWLAGLLLFSLIVWKVNAGNPAGFLRNLVPLMPLAALLAREGLAAALHALPRQSPAGAGQRPRILFLAAAAALAAATLFAGTHILRVDLFLRTPWLTGAFAAASAGLALVLMAAPRSGPRLELAAVAWLTALMGFFSFVTVPPDRFLNPEREAVVFARALIQNSPLRTGRVLASHIWYYWDAGVSPWADTRSSLLRSHVTAAAPGDVVLWDSHYSSRLGKDVDWAWMRQQTDWQLVFRSEAPLMKFRMAAFRRMGAGESRLNLLDDFIAAQPYIGSAWLERAVLRQAAGDSTGAAADFLKAAELDPQDPAIRARRSP